MTPGEEFSYNVIKEVIAPNRICEFEGGFAATPVMEYSSALQGCEELTGGGNHSCRRESAGFARAAFRDWEPAATNTTITDITDAPRKTNGCQGVIL